MLSEKNKCITTIESQYLVISYSNTLAHLSLPIDGTRRAIGREARRMAVVIIVYNRNTIHRALLLSLVLTTCEESPLLFCSVPTVLSYTVYIGLLIANGWKTHLALGSVCQIPPISKCMYISNQYLFIK